MKSILLFTLFGPDLIKTKNDLSGLISSTYVIAIVTAIFFLLLAFVVSTFLIQYKPDNSDLKKRRMVFWGFFPMVPTLLSVYCFLMVPKSIKILPFLNQFRTQATIAVIVAFVLYIVLGVLISYLFKTKQVGDWFFAKR